MAKIAKENWEKIDTSKLPANVREAFDASKEAYKAHKAEAKALPSFGEYEAARELFEGAMQELFAPKLPEGKELKFGYNFGGLSIAIGDKPTKKAHVVAKQGLASWLANMNGSGHNA
jgi:hypothetical protein